MIFRQRINTEQNMASIWSCQLWRIKWHMTKDLCSTLSRSRAVVFFFYCFLIKLIFCIEKITVCVRNSSLGPLKCLIRSFTLGKFLNVDNCEYICVFFNQNTCSRLTTQECIFLAAFWRQSKNSCSKLNFRWYFYN